MIATIRTWNGFHSGNNVTKIGNVCHLLHYFRNVIKLIFLIVMHLLSAYIKKFDFKMRIIFQFKLFRGENKIHWNNEVVDIPNIFIRHMLAMRLQFLLIFFFERIGDKNNIGVQ